MVKQNLSGLQWIASEAWTVTAMLQTTELMPYLGGTLGIAIRRGEIPGLRDFLLGLHPDLHEISNRNSLVNFRAANTNQPAIILRFEEIWYVF